MRLRHRILKHPNLLIVVVAIVAGALGYRATQTGKRPTTEDHTVWTEITLHAPDGRAHTLSAWQGQPLLLNFWASWCPPCREEIPDLNSLYARYAPHGLKFVGIAVENTDNVREFLKHTPIHYPVLMDEEAGFRIMDALGNSGSHLPYTVLLDRNGKPVARITGRLEPSALSAQVDRLLAEK